MLHKLVLVLAFVAALGEAQKRQDIFLPPDMEVFSVMGNSFKLELSQFQEMRETWKQAEQESAQVEEPKTIGGDSEDADQSSFEEQERARELERQQERQVDKAFAARARELKELDERRRASNKNISYGLIDRELQDWINVRATALIDRLERYKDEFASASNQPERVVLDVLQLNTVLELEDLVEEKIPSLAWLEKKMNALAKHGRFNNVDSYEYVTTFVLQAMKANEKIEASVKGFNNPGKKWLKNSVALKRIYNEQRFARKLDYDILSFLSGEFGMMRRSTVMEIIQGTQQVNTGLVYWAAKGRVSIDFPFAAQDAIANGAIY